MGLPRRARPGRAPLPAAGRCRTPGVGKDFHLMDWRSGAAAEGLALYVCLALATALSGRGLSRLLRLGLAEPDEATYAPVLTFLAWTLTLGMAVGLRLPVAAVAPWLWTASALLAIYGRPWRLSFRRHVAPLALCGALPLLTLAGRFAAGLAETADTVAMDGWFYMANGRFLYDHGRNSYAGPNVVHQFGSFFQEHRFMASGLLAFFSTLGEAGDTTRAGGLLQAWALFCLACAVRTFWRVQQAPRSIEAIATFMTLAGGWTMTVAWGNWFDQQLALVYMPALAVAATLEIGPARRGLLLGSLLAGLAYTYPEGALELVS